MRDPAAIPAPEEPPEGDEESSPKTMVPPTRLPQAQPEDEAIIMLNYPDGIELTLLLRHVAFWSDLNIIADPSLAAVVQIFAPRLVTKEQGIALFVAALESVGLRAVKIDENTVKIVPEVRLGYGV